MRKFLRATSVNDNGHRYFEFSDQQLLELRTKHLLMPGKDLILTGVPIFSKRALPIPHMIMSGNSSSLYTDAFRANFLWFEKNQQLVVRFSNDISS